MDNERLRRYAYLSVVSFFILLSFIIIIKYALVPLLPFLIAWGIAFLVRPVAVCISKRLKLPRRAVSGALALFSTLLFLGVLLFIVWLLLRQMWGLLSGLIDGGGFDELLSVVMSEGALGKLFGSLGESVAQTLYSIAASLLSSLASIISGWVRVVPKVVLFIIITVVASVYFSVDLEGINAAIKAVIPKSTAARLIKFKDGFISFGLKYLRAYLILMSVSFVVVLLGLTLLKVKYALLLALVIAMLDVLPVIGVGTVIIPWSVFCFAIGRGGLGAGLLVLLLVHEIVRQVIEPKILGKSLGIHPLITLILLYVGLAVFGVTGLLLVPVVCVVLDILAGKNHTAKVTKDTAGTEVNDR